MLGHLIFSDLLLHLEGAAFKTNLPRVSLISSIFSTVRKQVGSVAYAISGITDRKMLPKDVDLGLTAFAPGSLYLGFSLPDVKTADEDGQIKLFGEQDPLYKATKEAIRILGVVSGQVEEGATEDDITEKIPDPMVRDRALSALWHMSPSGRTGIDTISIANRSMGDRKFRNLTPEIRKKIHRLISSPVKSDETGEYIGTVREIDLDIMRFELRRLVSNTIEGIRCVYKQELSQIAKGALDKKVRVTGKIEKSEKGRPRLLEVQDIKIFD